MTLDEIRIASPCSADWNAMPGDDRVRTCGDCRKRVYNLAAMTRAEAEALIASQESLCVRLYRRRDGTVVTADCAPPVRKIRRRVAAGALAVLAGGCIDDAPAEENLDDDVTVVDDADEISFTVVPDPDSSHLTFKLPIVGGIASRSLENNKRLDPIIEAADEPSLDETTDLASLFPPPSNAFDDLRVETSMGALASLSFERAPDATPSEAARAMAARLEAAGWVQTIGVQSGVTANDAAKPSIESESTDE